VFERRRDDREQRRQREENDEGAPTHGVSPTIHQTNSPAAVSVSLRPSRAVGVGEAAVGVGRSGRWKAVFWTCLARGAQIGTLFLLPRFLLAQAVGER
jgi:hypothetical protein